MPNDTIKLQKFLADAGLGSRREIEHWIAAGRIQVAGKTATLGQRVSGEEKILVDGRALPSKKISFKHRYLLYYKPEGQICSRQDPEDRDTVFNVLPSLRGQRWIMVGRLDLNTSGLLLFTTDGELANRLMHPREEVEREYAVRVLGQVKPEHLQTLREGVHLEDGPSKFERLREAGGEGANRWYHVVLKRGRKHEVKRLWESQGFIVSRLIRIRYGQMILPPRMKQGDYIELKLSEFMQALKNPIEDTSPVKPATKNS